MALPALKLSWGSRTPDSPALPAALLVASCMALALLGPHRDALWLALLPWTGAFGAVLWLWSRHGHWLDGRWVVVGGAVVLRIIFLPTLPDLSDDLFRYVWDGVLLTHGVNPYRYLPTAPELAPLADPFLLAQMNSGGYFSIYPPLSQAVFAVGGWVHRVLGWPASAYAVKGVLLLLETGGVFLIWRAMLRWGLPLRHLALYAWNPLVLLTLAGSGHSEGALILGMGVLLWAMAALRPGWGWFGLLIMVLTKGIPLILAPLIYRYFSAQQGPGRTLGWALPSLGIGAAATLPLLHDPQLLAGVASSAELYVRLFEFNGGPYLAVKRLLGWVTGDDWSKVLGPVFRLLFLGGAVAIWLRTRGTGAEPVLAGGLLLFSLYLALATTVHPWYLTWGLVLLPVTALFRGAWLWASWAAFPTYLTYTGVPHLPLVALFWGGVLAIGAWETRGAIYSALLQVAGWRKARGIRPHLRGRRVLDLGGGEGFVGAHLAQGETRVVLAEVGSYGPGPVPGVRFDGVLLPFPTGSFDTVVLSLVLHHADDPDALLREALRVSRSRVVITESLYRWEWERALLEWVDRRVNAFRGSGEMSHDPLPLRFRTKARWEEAFRKLGAGLVVSRRLNRVGHRHHLFVLESPLG